MTRLFFVSLLASLLIIAGCASQGGGAGKGKSGTATASAQGFAGEVKVTVTMENGKIVKVDAAGPGETEAIGGRAIMMLPGQMVAKNTVEVDSVTGASMTSEGIRQAARKAVAEINK